MSPTARAVIPSALALSIVSLSLAGCIASPSPPRGVDGPGSPLDAALDAPPPFDGSLGPAESAAWADAEWHGFVGALYGAVCTRWRRCSGRDEGCRLDANAPFDRTVRALGEAILKGRIAVDPVAARACLATVRDGVACTPPWFEGPACARAFRGLQPDGGPCVLSDSCGPDAYCRLGAPCGGRCAPRGDEGDRCDDDAGCADGLFCDSHTCAVRPPRGSPCVDVGDCVRYERCVEGLCQAALAPAPAGPGELCRDAERAIDVGFPRDARFNPGWSGCAAGRTCAPTSNGLRCMPAGAEGDRCEAETGCGPDLTCDAGGARCVPQLEPGAPCDGHAGRCPQGMHCTAGRCLPPSPAGLACDGHDDCAQGDCVEGRCAPRETRCGRPWTPPPECVAAEDCPTRVDADAVCAWSGRCGYQPRGRRWHLTAPHHGTLPELAQLFGGWPGDDGWLLHLDGETQWLAPAVDGRPHPRLPAIPLSGLITFGDADLTTGAFYGANQHLLRPAADPCTWAAVPADLSVDFLWTRWPDVPLHVSTVLGVQHGLDIAVGDRPLDELMREHGMPSDPAGEQWWIRIVWQATPAPLEGEPVFDAPEPVDLCE